MCFTFLSLLTESLQYDPEWLAVLKETNNLTSISRHTHCVPTKGLHDRWEYSVDDKFIERVSIRLLSYFLIVFRNNTVFFCKYNDKIKVQEWQLQQLMLLSVNQYDSF